MITDSKLGENGSNTNQVIIDCSNKLKIDFISAERCLKFSF